MDKHLLEVPTQIETERLILRSLQPGDGPWYYAVGRKNGKHLQRYESGNVILSIHSEEEAEAVVRELAADWQARNCFFLAAFDKRTSAFVAQIYIGPVSWELPEFQIGYFADEDHQGRGYVTEAVKSVLAFIFTYLKAYRVRLECDDTNVRSYLVAERCGMRQEAHLRQNKRNADGTISGTLIYGLLRSEFEV